MDRRTNCYLNSAYNRNIDDIDDFIDNDSQLSFGSRGQSYESENETYVDDFLDDRNSCYTEGNHLASFNQSEIDNRSFGIQQAVQRYRYDSFMQETPAKLEKSTDRLTSTPKKQPTTLSSLKNPQRREAIVRRRSFSGPSRRDKTSGLAESNYPVPSIRRSKSSSSLRQRYEDQKYAIKLLPTSPVRYQQDVRNRSFHSFSQPFSHLPNVTSVAPFRIRQKQADILMKRNQFLRRPYDMNSSFSSTRPLVQRNTAVISPIYNKKSMIPSFEEDHSRVFTIAADRSPASSKNSSWLQIKKQSIPLCTLRTSAITLLVSGTLSCLLSLHIMAVRGKSYELLFSLISGFVILCLGFPCLRFQEWQWLPNRNYVSGYIVLSLFSLLQSAALWVLDKYPDMQIEIIDITKGALCGLAVLSMSIAMLGICTSCCCKYPPPDNRVSHGVQGFTI